jgi:ketosteroid isomerase-like protein
MRYLIGAFLLACVSSAICQETEIRNIMAEQEACWNNGDLECYMQGYWKSNELVFVGSGGPRYGWQVTLNNYKSSYPTPAAMGTLKFDILKLQPIGKKNYLVIGKWSLKRERDNPQGHFSLVWEKINGKWKIIADHSS